MPPRITGRNGTIISGIPVFEPLFPVAAATNAATLTTEAAKSELEVGVGEERAYSASAGTSRFGCCDGTYGLLQFAVNADAATASAHVWMYAPHSYKTTSGPTNQSGTILVPTLLFVLSITGGTRAVSTTLAPGGETLVWADTVSITTNNQIGSGYLAEVGPGTPANGIATLTFDRGWAWAMEVEVTRGTATKVQGFWAVQ